MESTGNGIEASKRSLDRARTQKITSRVETVTYDFLHYADGGGVRVHPAAKCAGETCCIHNPSDHPMREFPLYWRADRALMERICPHGTGHPDPDDLAYKKRSLGAGYRNYAFGTHGCDGCCGGWTEQTVPQKIAARIRDEFVCCGIYQRVQHHPVEKRAEVVRMLKRLGSYHDLCYWGEAAARVAEEFETGE